MLNTAPRKIYSLQNCTHRSSRVQYPHYGKFNSTTVNVSRSKKFAFPRSVQRQILQKSGEEEEEEEDPSQFSSKRG